MNNYYRRIIETELLDCLNSSPAVALLGPRQCGKLTLARYIGEQFTGSIYLDLENEQDKAKLHDPYIFFEHHNNVLVCLDEIQLYPEIFSTLRSIIDKNRRNGQLLILGSASRDLIRQSSETLAGRILYLELTPFMQPEIPETDIKTLWLRGGYPQSLLSATENQSFRWRTNFVQTYLERDIPQLGFNIPAKSLKRLWTMLAHSSGQILNSSRLGESLGVSHTTIRNYVDLLTQTFMIRVLPPYEANAKKRLVKSPKVYIRDTGILHSLLSIETYDNLLGNPIFGSSWESFVVEEICSCLPEWQPFFYRTSAGAEIDLVLCRGQRKIGIEIKAASVPTLSKGFYNSIADLDLKEVFVIALVKEPYYINNNIRVVPLDYFLNLIL